MTEKEKAMKAVRDTSNLVIVSVVDTEKEEVHNFPLLIREAEIIVRALLETMIEGSEEAPEKEDKEFDFNSVEEGAAEPSTKPQLSPWEKFLEQNMVKVVKSYRSDFYKHDISRLRKCKTEEPFVWVLREHGTQLLCKHEADSRGIEYFEAVARYYGNSVKFFYGKVNTGVLNEISAEEAINTAKGFSPKE